MDSKYTFNIIVDTREQKPWAFASCNTVKKKLDTGDYSIEGLEHLLCIERKNSVSEIANNISENRFKDEIERMHNYLYKFILLEFNLQDVLNYPRGSSVPPKLWSKIKIRPPYILKFLTELQTKHDIHVIFCDNPIAAEEMAFSIIKRIHEAHMYDKLQ
jgi:ERCC4-type nuclease